VQINERAGLTFAGGLRTILRQVPDVVMVGEIRDPETASIATQASVTAHLVMSTLHTNDAPSAVGRLIDMGVEPYLITSSLTLVVAQRLARVPCQRCAEPVEADPRSLELLGIDPTSVDTSRLVRGTGCGSCSQPGYQGRIGLFQVLSVTRHLRELVVARAPRARCAPTGWPRHSPAPPPSRRSCGSPPPSRPPTTAANATTGTPSRQRPARSRPSGTPPGSPGSPDGPLASGYCPAALKVAICMTQVPFWGAVAL
jgi:hypothetical protein